jgi:tripartite-type tricarboxylate transporter receptor subunit TctC
MGCQAFPSAASPNAFVQGDLVRAVHRRAVLSFLLCAASLPALAADQWPQRPVTLVVPYAAGGNTDTMARVVADRLGKALGQAVIVENRGGAGGMIAAQYVARAKPDGYTLFFGTVTQISTASYTNKIRFDPLTDFVPVANVGGNPYVIAARKDAPFHSLAELIQYAKAHPGKLAVGHAGVGGLTHLSAVLFMRRAGIQGTLIPYKGAAPALTDVLGGQIDFYSGNLSEVLPYAKGDSLQLLAVSSDKRVPQLPDVPTISETFPDYDVGTWNGILAPAGTPETVIDLLAAEMTKIHADKSFQNKLLSIGVTPIPEVKDAFRQRILADAAKWKPVILSAGITPQ